MAKTLLRVKLKTITHNLLFTQKCKPCSFIRLPGRLSEMYSTFSCGKSLFTPTPKLACGWGGEVKSTHFYEVDSTPAPNFLIAS